MWQALVTPPGSKSEHSMANGLASEPRHLVVTMALLASIPFDYKFNQNEASKTVAWKADKSDLT